MTEKKEPTQKTDKGFEIPVPTRGAFMNLRAGHTVQGDNPKEFSRALDAFLVRRLGLEG